MAGYVQDYIDEFQTLATARINWETYWRKVAMYVLPQTPHFDAMFMSGINLTPVNAVVDAPVAADRSKHLYDTTSLWGVERLSAGMLTLKTPESLLWHDLNVDSDFDYEASYDEKAGLERVRNYQFKVRSNPKSGFWAAHKAAVRSMCGFGDGWMFVEELHGERLPYRYEFVPLPDCYPAMSKQGLPEIMHRSKLWSAYTIVREWGPERAGKKLADMANDPKRKHERVQIVQAVRPRTGVLSGIGLEVAAFESCTFLPQEKHILGKSGFFEFPFVRYAWNNSGTSPFSEGPVAHALGEIQSINEMAKNELIGVQSLLRPPLGVMSKTMNRLNLNPGAVNGGLINGDGRPLFAPLNTGIRPDFARVVLDARRAGVREMLYLNLWQILLDKEQMTATEAMIRAQEKGELLGPVGISMNEGLSMMVDREIGILGRKGAFKPGSQLELPESMGGRDVAPQFTSPLDKLRRMGELVGMQRLVEFAAGLAEAGRTDILARLDADEMIELAQEILGAPVKVLRPREEAQEKNAANDQLQQLISMIGAAGGAGGAMKALGDGTQSLVQGAEAAGASPMAQRALQATQRALPAPQAGM